MAACCRAREFHKAAITYRGSLRGGRGQTKAHDLLLRYLRMLLSQTSRVAACNRLHTVAERVARWPLMSQDRCGRDDLPFTQEFIAIMPGIRRAGVTEAAIILQTEEYIRYRRGSHHHTGQGGMEDFACVCYRIVKDGFDRLVG